MDYVQEFIKFLEEEYEEKIKQMLRKGEKVLTVELTDIYRHNPYLAIRILNALLSGKDEIMYEILSNVAGLIKVLTNDIEGFTIRIPNKIEFLKFADKEIAGEKEEFKGYVAVKTTSGEIGIIRPLDDAVEIFLMKYNGKVKVGDFVSGYGVWKKKGGRCYFEAKGLEVEKESPMEELEEIDIDRTALLPEDYKERLIDFIEEYEKDGVKKYKAIIDEMIEKEEIKDIPLSIEDLLMFDEELGRPAMKDPYHVLSLFNNVIDIYVKTRFVLKKNLIPWAKLDGEKVVLKSSFAEEINKALGLSITQEKVAELIGGENNGGDVVIGFRDFVKFLAVYRSR